MAYTTADTALNNSRRDGGLLGAASAFFTTLLRARAVSLNTEGRMEQIERLSAMTDAELAERGLRRDDIVRHVFRDLYYV